MIFFRNHLRARTVIYRLLIVCLARAINESLFKRTHPALGRDRAFKFQILVRKASSVLDGLDSF